MNNFGHKDTAPDESSVLIRRLWKEMLKTGAFLVATLIVLVIGTIAWFVSNDRTQATTASVSAQHDLLRLATKGDRQIAEMDYLRIQVDRAQPDGTILTTEETLPDGETHPYNKETYYYTDGGAIALRLDGNNVSISPGAHGKVTFYIIPTKEGPIRTTLHLVLAGYELYNDNITSVKKARRVKDETLYALLSGHILLFENYDPKTRNYSGWLGNPDSQENRIFISIDNAEIGVPKPVTFYWIWPLRYKSMADDLFVKGSEEYKNIFAPWLSRQTKDESMSRYDIENYYFNRIFLTNRKSEDLSDPVFTNDAYNRADEYIGTHADYLFLSIQTYAP